MKAKGKRQKAKSFEEVTVSGEPRATAPQALPELAASITEHTKRTLETATRESGIQ